MGPVVVVVVAPVLDNDSGFEQVREVLDVEAFVSEAAVERLDMGVLPGGAGLDVGGVGARGRAPVAQCVGGELGPVEFLTVVKSCGGVHAGVGAGGVSERLATPLLSRSSLLLALRALEIDRLAARTSSGI